MKYICGELPLPQNSGIVIKQGFVLRDAEACKGMGSAFGAPVGSGNQMEGGSYSPNNIGKTYKGHGTIIGNIPIDSPSGIYRGNSSDPYHYINRVTGRNVSTTDIYNTIKDPTVVLSQWKDRDIYM